ncbi:MAG TPA: amidohydrolase family protein [Thermoanaerobaculia bacterium]|jgi:imidazolonepropionase-like amidohydrolase|nr:amidohydrolase family protein [Thermoanaerobaculia bacterium]
MKRLLLLLVLAAASVHAETVYIKAARMFDGRSETITRDAVVAVDGTKIVSLGGTIPSGARVIDLGDVTLMPGLIDAHTHIALHPGNYNNQVLGETAEYRAILSTVNARQTLEAGITTIRDLGNEGAGFTDVALRDAIARGFVPGPRIVAAIHPLVTTGAYRVGGYAPTTNTPAISAEANGPDAMRAAVRQLINDGADVIKVYLDSGRHPQHAGGGARPTYSQAEIDALVAEAHAAGAKVAAHCSTDAAAKMAVIAGVDSLEHGLSISEETFRAMAAKGVVYVPTLLVFEMWAADPDLFGEGPSPSKEYLDKTVREHTASFQRALKTPVKIAFGTDTFAKTGTNAQELDSMVRAGMRPIDALRAATSVSAALLGVDDITGTIEPGKAADIIAVGGDPSRDIKTVQHPTFVMKDGKVFIPNS